MIERFIEAMPAFVLILTVALGMIFSWLIFQPQEVQE